MPSKTLPYKAFTSMDRNAAISRVSGAVTAAGGWVSGHSLFSNLAAVVNFEIPAEGLTGFLEALRAAGLTVRPASERRPPQTGDVAVSLSLTFSSDEPDLKRNIPPFG